MKEMRRVDASPLVFVPTTAGRWERTRVAFEEQNVARIPGATQEVSLMRIALNTNGTIRRSVKRMALALLEDSSSQLVAIASPARDEAVHQLRRNLRTLRALLELVRSEVRVADFKKERNRIRKLGRQLATLRDVRVLRQSLEQIAEFQSMVELDHVTPICEVLDRRLDVLHDEFRSSGMLDHLHRQLMRASECSRKWARVPDRWRTIGPGLQRSLRRMQVARGKAAERCDLTTLHGWRKQTRNAAIQIAFLRSINRYRMRDLSQRFSIVNKRLGTLRDRLLLARFLAAESTGPFQFSAAQLESEIRRWAAVEFTELISLSTGMMTIPPEELVHDLKLCWREIRRRRESR